MDIENVTPVGERVLLDIYIGKKETDSGLIMASTGDDTMPIAGTVKQAGSKSAFKEGDVVLFRRYGVDELKLNDKGEEVKVYLVEDADIIGIIKK